MQLLSRPTEDDRALEAARAAVKANVRLFEFFGESQVFAAGEAVFQQGDEGDALFVVTSGVVEIQSDYMLIGAAQAHDIFGEMALIDGGLRSAAAICATDVAVIRLDYPAFQTVLRIDSQFVELLMRRMSMRIRRLNQLARTDALTGALVRGHFFDLAGREIARARRDDRPLGVLMIDVDHFKAVNDAYGHAAGDETLRRIAEIARGQLRPSDVFGRIGGEEFAAALPNVGPQDSLLVAERLRQAVDGEDIAIGGNRMITCTVSIGAASMRAGDESFEAALARADERLYTAKDLGRNRVVGPEGEVQIKTGIHA